MNEILEFLRAHMEIVYVLRIVLAGICGGVIGMERTLRQKDAGFRTHIIVSISASILMIISKYGFFDVVVYDSIQLDASRIASTIITGFSFLGAGMIFVKGVSIKGLTTAAGILATGAIGMAVGAGMYVVGLTSVVLLLLVQVIFHKFLIGFDKVLANDNITPCFIQIDNKSGAVEELKKFFAEKDVHISDFSVYTVEDNAVITLRINVQMGKKVNIDEVLEELRTSRDGIRQAFTL